MGEHTKLNYEETKPIAVIPAQSPGVVAKQLEVRDLKTNDGNLQLTIVDPDGDRSSIVVKEVDLRYAGLIEGDRPGDQPAQSPAQPAAEPAPPGSPPAPPAVEAGQPTPEAGQPTLETLGEAEAQKEVGHDAPVDPAQEVGRPLYTFNGDPANIDGTTWGRTDLTTDDGRALYFYAADAPGMEPAGDNLGGVWHLYTGPTFPNAGVTPASEAPVEAPVTPPQAGQAG